MSEPSDIDWDTGDKSAMVSIGTHKLYLSASGPDRKPGEPIVLLMQGMGSTIDEWVMVKRLVTPFARWVEYDRSGLGRSEDHVVAPETISAASVAADLDILLKTAGVVPPYVIVAHSWGGFTSREFIQLQEKNIAGIVLVDTVTEFSDAREAIFATSPWTRVMGKGVDDLAVSSLNRDRKLSPDEWDIVMNEQNNPRRIAIEAAELKGYFKDRPELVAKKQLENQILGSRPVSVLAANNSMDCKAHMRQALLLAMGPRKSGHSSGSCRIGSPWKISAIRRSS
jgi:pimeloyl-ACP methyl ester carboxylesterase